MWMRSLLDWAWADSPRHSVVAVLRSTSACTTSVTWDLMRQARHILDWLADGKPRGLEFIVLLISLSRACSAAWREVKPFVTSRYTGACLFALARLAAARHK